MQYFISLSTPFGDKDLYVNEAGIGEFFTMPPAGTKLVEFETKEEADQFIEKHYAGISGVYVCSHLI